MYTTLGSKPFKSLAIVILSLLFFACKQPKKEQMEAETTEDTIAQEAAPFFKLSLAQWSMHKMILEDGMDPYDFAKKANEWGFEGLEYVSQLYREELEADDYSEKVMQAFVDKCNEEAKKYGLANILIMIDGQGNLADEDAVARKEAVENHYKWVDAAAAMGCHSIRVNLQGSEELDVWTAASVDGLTQLATYAKEKDISILVENHGGPSSHGAWLAAVMKQVNLPNCGTLPDFGNFCIQKENQADYGSTCINEYDKYKGVKELMPYAKAVSAKSYDFDKAGNETKIDYAKMMGLVKAAGYDGFVGVEYEGNRLGEAEGILATKALLLNVAKTN